MYNQTSNDSKYKPRQVTLKKDNQKLASETENIPKDLLRWVVNGKKGGMWTEKAEKSPSKDNANIEIDEKMKKLEVQRLFSPRTLSYG